MAPVWWWQYNWPLGLGLGLPDLGSSFMLMPYHDQMPSLMMRWQRLPFNGNLCVYVWVGGCVCGGGGGQPMGQCKLAGGGAVNPVGQQLASDIMPQPGRINGCETCLSEQLAPS